MTPILNGNLSIHAIRLKLKKDPFPSKLCSHIPSKMDLSRPPGIFHYCMFSYGGCTFHTYWLSVSPPTGRVYNVSPYMDFHPGGVDELMRGAGKDGTDLFDDVRNSGSPL